ncbi:GNAT family N-acetyltransferase [Actinokineospora enzanensis]|uniref:GNAT family N-acetyltransferase n=1 Tax=Actinokineospora enzanensis TaxID=155975 RepID=UPI00037AC763|nr:GNAT family protein [Actinokineospora enzanensis]
MPSPAFPITTRRLILRPLDLADAEAIHAYQSREDVTTYLYWGPRTRAETEEALRRRVGPVVFENDGDVIGLAVTSRDSGALIGDVILAYNSVQHRTAEIGYVISPDHHGHGYAHEAATELLRLAFEHYGMHRVIGRLDAANHASARVLEKLGLRREAHFVQNEFVRGRWADEAVYAMLAHEWTAPSTN